MPPGKGLNTNNRWTFKAFGHIYRPMTEQPFIKMHGLGNDFVILDARRGAISLSAKDTQAIADRKRGVGCDQLIIIEPIEDGEADVFMRIKNADGSEVAACGNATRCVADLLMTETGRSEALIQTVYDVLEARREADGRITVDMGLVRFDWRDVPLSEARDTREMPLDIGGLSGPSALNIGNPHCVFFVDDVSKVDVESIGAVVEKMPLFPEFTNVQFVQVLGPNSIRQRVWERGVGVTEASGSGACAGFVAAARRGLTTRRGDVHLDGGILSIDWLADDHVMMTGPVAFSFTGKIDPSLLVSSVIARPS